MYCDPSFKTKKALKEAVASGQCITVFSPGPFPAPTVGEASVEGPNFKMHTWYARVRIEGGVVTKVLS